MDNSFIVGTFISEERNRFLCKVRINDCEEECYIPSSCRLDNFVSLSGKTVLLRKNKNTKGRTRYSVFALKNGKSYIILRPAEGNDMVFSAVQEGKIKLFNSSKVLEREFVINGYKTDIYLPEDKTLIEVKSIISLTKKAVFPTVYSERAIDQLSKIDQLLNEGYRVVYVFVSLNPQVKEVSISCRDVHSKYRELFIRCVNNGMKFRAYSAQLRDESSMIKNEIPVLLEEA